MSTRSRHNRRQRQRIQATAAITANDVSTTTLLTESVKHYGSNGTLEEARKNGASSSSGGGKKGTPNNKSLSVAWDESEALGIPSVARREGLMSDRDRKDTLYKAWLGNVWISAAGDVIAKRITSGGVHIKEAPGIKQGEGDPKEFDLLNELVHRVNDEEDFLYLVRGTLTDLGCIFGEAYWEIVPYSSPEVGKTVQLIKIDCITMSYKLDPHGQITGYEQNMDRYQDSVQFTAEEVVRWWYPDPRASKKALSPIERILGPTDADSRMQDWTRLFFKRGARPNLWIEFLGGKDEAERFIIYLRENYTGQLNAHVPLVTYEGAKVHEIGKGTVDVDFVKGREMSRQEVLAAFLVPPALVGVIESGNIGGGTGESQDKSLQFNACDPLKSLFLEKFNYRVVKKALNVKTWVVDLHYAEYAGNDMLSKIDDMRIRNGSNTINETRAGRGLEPVEGGDTAIITSGKEITAIETLQFASDTAKQTAEVTIQQQQAQLELTKVQVERAKNPPPVPTALQSPQNGNKPPVGKVAQQPPQGKPQPAQESLETRLAHALADVERLQRQRDSVPLNEDTAHHTGMTLAFMLDEETARRLAIPDGEPAEDLHITLAFLGDSSDFTGDIEQLKRCIAAIASEMKPLQGKVSGVGRFSPSDSSDDTSPVIALVDVQGLHRLRDALVMHLEALGIQPANDFAYTPHITLAYIDPDAPMPIIDIQPPVYLALDTICLAVGDDRTSFKMGDEQYPDYWDSKPHESVIPDLMARIEEALRPLDALSAQEDRRRKWREPSLDQLHIEAQMQTALALFIRSVKIGDGGNVKMPAMSSLTQSIADWLEQAHNLGVAHASDGTKEALSLPKPKDWFGKAQQIVQLLAVNIADKIAEWIDELTGDSSAADEIDIVDEVTAQLEAYAGTEAELIAMYEVPAAIENGVLQTFYEMNVLTKGIAAQEGACANCIANADQGEISLSEAFQSGEDAPPFHSRCRCSLIMGSAASDR